MDAIRAIARGCGCDTETSVPPSFVVSVWQRVMRLEASPSEIAQAWTSSLDADSNWSWPSPVCRGVFLACLAACMEIASDTHGDELAGAIRGLVSKSGAQLNVGRTRCEIFGRAAEGLFKEARRRPSDGQSNKMLGVAEVLLCVLLADYRNWVDPSFVRRWLGMRGTARLLLAGARKIAGKPVSLADWTAAADDLLEAFDAGNRGSSAAAYLLDAYLHCLEHAIDAKSECQQRIEKVLSQLSPEELAGRAVQAQIGRYHFTRSFQQESPVEDLMLAIEHLDRALQLPVAFAFEDHFLYQLRGQIKLRLAMALEHADATRSEREQDEGIDNLLRASGLQRAYRGHPSLGSALLIRSDRRVRAGDLRAAQEDLDHFNTQMLAEAPQALRDQAAARSLQLSARRALSTDDVAGLEAALTRLNACPHVDFISWLFVGRATRRLFHLRTSADSPRLLEQAVDALAERMPTTSEAANVRRQHLELLAVLTFRLMEDWHEHLWPLALDRFDTAMRESREDGDLLELMGHAGTCKLHVAKMRLRQGDWALAQDLLEEAAEIFVACTRQASDFAVTAEGFRLDVAFSRAGEAFHRLSGLTGSELDIRSAIQHFEESGRMGNNTPHLRGLLGDAWYRLYRATRDRDALSAAIDLKEAARQSGKPNRENLSLSGRMLFLRWELTGDAHDLLGGIRAVTQAAVKDPLWPWPPFQLHDQLQRVEAAKRAAVLEAAHADQPNALISIAREAGLNGLAEHGCRLVIANKEFARQSLGGRRSRDVYVLDDSHGLLGQSYVFKHTDRENAERDVAATRGFAAFLQAKGMEGLRVPEAITIMGEKQGRGVIHVMRRSKGYQLGQIAIRAKRARIPVDTRSVSEALIYLAAYHAWGEAEEPGRLVGIGDFLGNEQGKRLAGLLDQPPEDTRALLRALRPVLGVRKKDAHPENWLVDQDGRLVMIDFESKTSQPILYDVALLLDDYPFFTVDDNGWQQRIGLCNAYLDELKRLRPELAMPYPEMNDALYGLMATIRSAIGVKKIRVGDDDVDSSSTTRAGRIRMEHYFGLLDYLRGAHREPGVRSFADFALRRLN